MKINKNLSILLSGQLVSQVGDKFYMLALSYWVLETTGSPTMMGVVLSCALFPSLILGFVSGAYIDKYDRKTIIVGADLIRGIVISGVATAYLMDVLTMPVIIVSQTLLSISAAFFDPAIPSVIPQIVENDQLTKANSKTQFISGFSSIAGPVLGGMAVAGFGYSFIFIFNALSFFISGFFEMFLKIPKIVRKDKKETTIKQDIIQGYKYILFDKRLIIIIAMVAVIHFFVGSIEVIIPVFAVSLKGNGAQNLGYIQASFGLGAVLMAFVISIISINRKEVKLLFTAIFAVGLIFLGVAGFSMAGFNVVVPFLFIFLFLGSLIILAGTSFKSILQKNVDNEIAGRVFSVVSSVGNGSIPLAMLIYGILLTYFSFNKLLMVTGFILLPLSLYCYRIYKGVNNAGYSKNRASANRYEN